MPWTYPPQFSLLMAPFALIPVGFAYLLFAASTLTLYLAVLRRIAGKPVRSCASSSSFPTIGITLACGQNGFAHGCADRAWSAFSSRSGPSVAGAALGLMIIKPHLAIAFAVYAVLRRSWVVV